MARPSEIEAKTSRLFKDVPPREAVILLLNRHETLTSVADILDVSISALCRYVEKNKIAKNTVTHWGDQS